MLMVMKLRVPHSIRISFDEDPDINSVESEPHTFQPNSQRVMELKVNDFPISEIKKVDINCSKNHYQLLTVHTQELLIQYLTLRYLRLFKLNKAMFIMKIV